MLKSYLLIFLLLLPFTFAYTVMQVVENPSNHSDLGSGIVRSVYDIPVGTTNVSIYLAYSNITLNTTFPQACFYNSTEDFQFDIQSWAHTPGNSVGSIYCYNGTDNEVFNSSSCSYQIPLNDVNYTLIVDNNNATSAMWANPFGKWRDTDGPLCARFFDHDLYFSNVADADNCSSFIDNPFYIAVGNRDRIPIQTDFLVDFSCPDYDIDKVIYSPNKYNHSFCNAFQNSSVDCSLNISYRLNSSQPYASIDYSLLFGNGTTSLFLESSYVDLNFSELTSGYVSWTPNVGFGDGFTFTNVTSVSLNLSQIPYGYVSIVFNDGQQLYEFFNSFLNSISERLFVEDPDLIQPVQLWDGIQNLFGKIDVFKLSNQTFFKVFSTYTDDQGSAEVLVVSGNSYKFTGSADDYNSYSQIEYIEPTSESIASDTIFIELSSTSDIDNLFTYQTNCLPIVRAPTTCSITANANLGTHTFLFNYSIGGSSTNVSYTSTSATILPYVDNDTEVLIYINGNFTKAFYFDYNNVSTSATQFDPSNIRESINSELQYIATFIIVIIILASLLGMYVEKKFTGWGTPSAFLFITLGGFMVPILFVVGILYGLWFIYGNTRKVGA